jgi:hypothetical protein
MIPQDIKQQALDTLVSFVAEQARKVAGDSLSDKIKGLRSDAAFGRKFSAGLERALARFFREYELQPIYSLRFAHMTAEATRQQVELQREALRLQSEMSMSVRNALLQLTDVLAVRKLLPAGEPDAAPAPVANNLPQPDHGQFIGREAELEQVLSNQQIRNPEGECIVLQHLGTLYRKLKQPEKAPRHHCLPPGTATGGQGAVPAQPGVLRDAGDARVPGHTQVPAGAGRGGVGRGGRRARARCRGGGVVRPAGHEARLCGGQRIPGPSERLMRLPKVACYSAGLRNAATRDLICRWCESNLL